MIESVLTTYYITFLQIQKQCPLSADLLRLFAFLDRQMVPERFLVESGFDGTTDIVLFRKAVGYFLGYLLISRVSGPGDAGPGGADSTSTDPKSTDPKSYDVHRLVHLSMETYISQNPDEAIVWKMRALGIVSRLFPIFRSICSAYLPHALAVIPYSDDAEPNLRENFAGYLSFKGEYDAAEGHLIRCLEIRERASSDTFTVLRGLSPAYYKQGEYTKALEWCGRALAREE
jgi:tetratricopeptide (TPR) repeat protein